MRAPTQESTRGSSRQLRWAVVVAVALVVVVEVALDEVVDVVAVRYGRVSAGWAVHVALLVARAGVARRASRRVRGIHRDRAFVDVITVHVMKVPVMQVVDVPVVLHCAVAATRSVQVIVRLMNRVCPHDPPPYHRRSGGRWRARARRGSEWRRGAEISRW